MTDQTPDPIDVIALAHRTESLTQRGHWVSIGSLESHRKVQLSRSDLDDLRATAIELRRLEAERSDHLWLLSGSRMTLDGIAEGREGPTEAAAQAQRIVDHIGHRLTDEPPHTLVENDELRGWKESAINVLSEWDEVFDALGRPGKLGASKAESALTEVERMTAAGLRTAALADDATRQEVEAIEWALRHVPTAVGSGVRSRAAELLAAAYLGRND